MTEAFPEDPIYRPYQGLPSSRLLCDRLRRPVEEAASRYFGRAWRVTEFHDMVDYASHPAAILSDGRAGVFVKLSEAAHGLDQFEVELAGLRRLRETAGVLTPPEIGIVRLEGAALLVQEALASVERTAEPWREIGRTLARIHLHKGTVCGLERQGYWGPLYLDNRPLENWLDFFVERRAWPRLLGAIDSGLLSTEMIRRVERLLVRLPGLDLPPGPPCLLHGDAQQNNFISTARGAVVIDPAVYYSHAEMDLAYVDYFQAVPAEVFAGYAEILPIAPGFEERRDLWRLPGYLAAVQVEGAQHLFRLERALARYE